MRFPSVSNASPSTARSSMQQRRLGVWLAVLAAGDRVGVGLSAARPRDGASLGLKRRAAALLPLAKPRSIRPRSCVGSAPDTGSDAPSGDPLTASLTVHVQDARGAPLPGFGVRLRPDEEGSPAHPRQAVAYRLCDRHGIARFDALQPGLVHCECGFGIATTSQAITLHAGRHPPRNAARARRGRP